MYPRKGRLCPLAGLIFSRCFSDNVISERTNVVYEFGPFRLEVREHRLVREGRSIPLTGKAFETLRVLVERHGTLVSKRDLMSAVWPETTVEENNLDRNISTVRKALGEMPSGRQYIETETFPIRRCQHMTSPPSPSFPSWILVPLATKTTSAKVSQRN